MANNGGENREPEMTTFESGVPAPSDDRSLTVGPAGPSVLHDAYVVEKMQQFNRERVPERVVHAKGSGAFGFFEVTEDATPYTKDRRKPGGRPNRCGFRTGSPACGNCVSERARQKDPQRGSPSRKPLEDR